MRSPCRAALSTRGVSLDDPDFESLKVAPIKGCAVCAVVMLAVGLLVCSALVNSYRGANYARLRVESILRSGIQEVSSSDSEGALRLLELQVDVQQDPSEYVDLITNHVEKERVLRWYISRIEDGKATLEVVVSR